MIAVSPRRSWLSRFALLVLGVFLVGCARSERGVLVMAHGGDGEWNEAIEKTVAPLRRDYPLEVAYGMAQASTIREGVTRLERRGASRIAVVRMFISGESFLGETEYILGLRSTPPQGVGAPAAAASGGMHADHPVGHVMEPPEQVATNASIVLSREGISESPLVDEILVERVSTLSTDPASESVLIIGHGPGDNAENERWLAMMGRRTELVRASGPFRDVRCETLREDWPEERAAAEARIRAYVMAGQSDGGRVLVIPFRVAGFGPYKEVLEGLSYFADGRGFCPHPAMTRWVREAAAKCFQEAGGGM